MSTWCCYYSTHFIYILFLGQNCIKILVVVTFIGLMGNVCKFQSFIPPISASITGALGLIIFLVYLGRECLMLLFCLLFCFKNAALISSLPQMGIRRGFLTMQLLSSSWALGKLAGQQLCPFEKSFARQSFSEFNRILQEPLPDRAARKSSFTVSWPV